MLPPVKALNEARLLSASRLIDLAHRKKVDTIQEMQRTAVICRRIINEGLVRPDEALSLYRRSSLGKTQTLEPDMEDARAFRANILERLQNLTPLDSVSLKIVSSALTSVTRLFVEYGAMLQIELNQSIVGQKVPMSDRTISESGKLVKRLDKEHWLWIVLTQGSDALQAVVETVLKAKRAWHKSAVETLQQENRD